MSNLETMKSAYAKPHPVEKQRTGEETVGPQRRGKEAWKRENFASLRLQKFSKGSSRMLMIVSPFFQNHQILQSSWPLDQTLCRKSDRILCLRSEEN